jgi:hypothetical protein
MLFHSSPLNKIFVGITSAVLLWFLGLSMWQLWRPDPDLVTMNGITLPFGAVQLRIHDLAAIFLIAALAVAVGSHAWPKVVATQEGHIVSTSDLEVSGRYKVILALMVLGPVVALGVNTYIAPGHTIIFLEWWEIAWFCVFWFVETRRIGRALRVSGGGP